MFFTFGTRVLTVGLLKGVCATASLLLLGVVGAYPALAEPTGDDRLMAMAEKFPGFAGMFVDASTDTLYLYMTGRSTRSCNRRRNC